MKIFTDQVANAKMKGIRAIACDAARKDEPNHMMTGYSVWPRVGYGQLIENVKPINVREDILRKFPGVVDIRDLLATPDGRAYWEKNGNTLMNCVFDLSDNSRSLRTLARYMIEKGRKK